MHFTIGILLSTVVVRVNHIFFIFQGVVIILEDNYPGEQFGYLLGVYTGSRINSSTDANVGVKLMGENGDSRVYFIIKYYKTHLL